MSKKELLSLVFFLVATSLAAQQSEKVLQYIGQYKEIAMAEMKRTGVPAAITLAQGIHESGMGKGRLATEANNHFGIKCKNNWTGESIRHDDDAKAECFRKYASAEESYKDHSDFLKNNQRYAFLFQLPSIDYEGWANGLKQAGYATNSKYPQVLIKLITDYNLQDYTLLALNDSKATGTSATTEVAVWAAPPVEDNSKMEVLRVVAAPIYPEGEFKINETKVMFVKKGTSFLSIAQQYKIDLAKLFEVNELGEAEISDRDQLIYLQRKRKTGNNSFHIVQAGETLHDIAQAEAIRLESLLSLNWLEGDMQPAIGEKLFLKDKSTAMPKLALKENYSILPASPKKSGKK